VVNYNDGTKPGSVTMLDTAAGTVLHTTPLGPGPEALAVDSRDGRVMVVGNLVVSVLDAAGGALRGTVSTQSAGPIAVDEGTGRVFIANDNSFGVVSVLDAGALPR
jgi:DNA-binding beta-propeller fold protein YncE